MYRPKVYTASKPHHHVLWKKLKENPDWDFVEWTATWIDHSMIHLQDAEIPSEVFAEGWTQNLWDVVRSDFVLVYSGGEVLRGALVEAGMGLSRGLIVVAIGCAPTDSWTYHPAVRRFPNLVDARQFLYRYTTMVPPNRKGRRTENE